MISSSSRDTALCGAWALIEALAVAAILVAVTATLPAGAPRLAAMPLIALMVSTALIARLGGRLPLRPPFGRLLALPVVLALALGWLGLVLPATSSSVSVASLGLVALLTTARGTFIGMNEPAQAAVMRSFLRGVVALMGLFALLSLAHVEVTPTLRDQLRALVLLYFATGPVVVALAQRRSLRRARGVHVALTPSWLLAVALPILSALAFAVLVSRGSDGARDGLAAASHAIGTLVSLTARAIASVAYAGVFALRWIARLFPAARGQPGTPPPPPPESGPDEAPLVSVGPPMPLTVVQHDIAAGVLLVTAALFISIYVSKLLRAPVESDDPFDADEERASLWSWKLMAQQARDLLRALLSTRPLGRDADARDARHRELVAAGDLSSVRGVYRAFLRWADVRGGGRAPTTTPHELAARMPCSEMQRPHVDALTDLYAQTRYGERDDTSSDLSDAREHFDALTARATAPHGARDPGVSTGADRAPPRRN